jgi:hypothetical protein
MGAILVSKPNHSLLVPASPGGKRPQKVAVRSKAVTSRYSGQRIVQPMPRASVRRRIGEAIRPIGTRSASTYLRAGAHTCGFEGCFCASSRVKAHYGSETVFNQWTVGSVN